MSGFVLAEEKAVLFGKSPEPKCAEKKELNAFEVATYKSVDPTNAFSKCEVTDGPEFIQRSTNPMKEPIYIHKEKNGEQLELLDSYLLPFRRI